MTRVFTIASAAVLAAALATTGVAAGAAPPTTPPPTTTPDFVLPPGWRTLVDDTNTISVAVPETWSDIDLAPESNPDGTLVPSIEAAESDIGVFTETFDQPGILYRAFAYTADHDSLMSRYGLTGGCVDRDITPYDDGAFSGIHGAWTDCGTTLDPEWHQIVASPASRSFTMVLQIQITSTAQQDIVDNILASFNFTPAGGALPGPFPPNTLPTQSTATTPMTTSSTAPATPTTTPFPPPSGTVPADATQLVDDLGVLSIHVPPSWIETDTSTFNGNDLTGAPYIAASPDLGLFLPGNATDTFSVPGVYYLAIPYLSDVSSAMRQWGTISACAPADAQPYSDGVFTGFIRIAPGCGGTSTRIVTIVANTSDTAHTYVLLLQLTGVDDAAIYDTVLSSFTVIGPAATGAPTFVTTTTTG
jgi:hypothetical protein